MRTFSGYPRLRLKTLASLINEKGKGLKADLTESYVSTDYKPAGCRYRTRIGKGRKGHLLTVRDAKGKVIFSHDSAMTYRDNSEVMYWIERNLGRIWEEK